MLQRTVYRPLTFLLCAYVLFSISFLSFYAALTKENDQLRENCERAEPTEAVQQRMKKLQGDKSSIQAELTRMKLGTCVWCGCVNKKDPAFDPMFVGFLCFIVCFFFFIRCLASLLVP